MSDNWTKEEWINYRNALIIEYEELEKIIFPNGQPNKLAPIYINNDKVINDSKINLELYKQLNAIEFDIILINDIIRIFN